MRSPRKFIVMLSVLLSVMLPITSSRYASVAYNAFPKFPVMLSRYGYCFSPGAPEQLFCVLGDAPKTYMLPEWLHTS